VSQLSNGSSTTITSRSSYLKLIRYILLIVAAIYTILSVNFGESSVVLPLVLIGVSFIEIPINYKLSLMKYIGWAIIFSSAYFVFRFSIAFQRDIYFTYSIHVRLLVGWTPIYERWESSSIWK